MKLRQKIKFEYKITLLYLFFGGSWILFSDKILLFLIDDSVVLTQIQTYKGWMYVIITALLFFHFLKRHLDKLKKSETELQNSNEKLKEAIKKAEESDRLKTAFLHNMSHEIRTPMNGIIGFSDLLSSPIKSEAKRNKYAQIVQKSSKQLLSIVDDILDISKIETGQTKITEEIIDLHEFCSVIINRHIADAREKNIELISCNHECEPKTIFVDKEKIYQITNKLINNAIKFSMQGTVQLKCRIIDNELEISISDTGIGIEKSLQDKMFDRFRQAELTTTRHYGGTGLGLSICKGLVEAMKGKIWVNSDLGKGSTFYFSIPFKTVPENLKAKPETTSKKLDNLSKFTILAAEDEDINYLYLEEILSDLQVNMVHVRNGLDAVKYIKSKQNADLILMDIKMPIMNGYEATSEIKKIKPKIPIIAVTAYTLREDKEKALKMGCDDYLAKPVNPKKLKDYINKQLTNRVKHF